MTLTEHRGIVMFNLVVGRVCDRCGSGEVHFPMQTCAPLKVTECLRCGKIEEY